MDALIDAMLPDQLCLAIVELGDERLRPDCLPQQFRQIEAAARYIRAHDITLFTLQRAIARQAVLSAGQALAAAGFDEAVGRLVASASPASIDA
jgi:hypothetical protein